MLADLGAEEGGMRLPSPGTSRLELPRAVCRGALQGLLRHAEPGPAPWSSPFPGAVPAAREQKMGSQGHSARNTHKYRLLIHSWNCQEKPIFNLILCTNRSEVTDLDICVLSSFC